MMINEIVDFFVMTYEYWAHVKASINKLDPYVTLSKNPSQLQADTRQEHLPKKYLILKYISMSR